MPIRGSERATVNDVSPAIDRMSVDERAVFVRMLATMALNKAINDINSERQQEEEAREGAAGGGAPASPAVVARTA
jgi:hypothetical protein